VDKKKVKIFIKIKKDRHMASFKKLGIANPGKQVWL
jgi:hypothetical protein